MHPYLAATLASTLTRDRIASAAGRDAATRARRASGGGGGSALPAGALVIRRAVAADATALARLGTLDGDRRTGELLARLAREHAVLVAEVDGTIEAALALNGRGAVADPFRPTAVHAELLALRARQLGGDAPRDRVRHARLGVLEPRLP